MSWHRLVVPAVVGVVLLGGGWLSSQAQEKEKGGRPEKGKNSLLVIAKKLNLDDKQQEQLGKIEAEYGPKRQKLMQEVRKVTQQEMKAFEEILTDDQKQKFQEIRQQMRKKGPRPPQDKGAPAAGGQ